jgi:ATP/maltotriose-dependent transcriptional regulator MalT/DNA-binding SARP family transcriptional activator
MKLMDQTVVATLIRSKVVAPQEGTRVVARPRVAQLICDLHSRYRVLWVTATAGAGKTTAVLKALADLNDAVAWLTIDTPDAAAGRLLTYLEAALLEVIPGMSAAASDALGQGIGHIEAAGLLAQQTSGTQLTVVVDELERIADSDAALSVLSSFLRHAPATLHTVLISRRPVPLDVSRNVGIAGMGSVSESDLAFTVQEAADALQLIGRASIDATEAVKATGGWVAGVLFEAWRSDVHVHGAGGEADPLSGYLATEIMSTLGEPEQSFLISTSLLEEVTPARAEALGLAGAAERLAELRTRHLPVTFATNRLVMRCHPRFREYLRDRLDHGDPASARALRHAHARLLCDERRYEDATEEFLAIGSIDAAESAAERAILEVIARGDAAVAARWLAALPEDRIRASRVLTEAELRVALYREEYGAGAQCADRLLAMFGSHVEAQLSSSLAGAIAWCYFLVCRIDDARAVLAASPPGRHRDIMSFAVGVDVFDDPAHYRDRPPDSGDPIDNMLARIDLLQGRFQRLVERPPKPWTRSSYIGALRALGRLDEALALFQKSSFGDWTTVRMYVELMADLNQPQDAWTALIEGRPLLERAGSGVFRMFALLLEVMLALRFDRNTSLARAALAAVEREPTALQRIRIVEQLELWRGMIALIEDDPEAAAGHLRRAVDIMVTWDRWLYLCQAAVYLAEAEWRLENEDAADAAAELGLRTAENQGSNHLLLQALREFPAVASRSIDAEPDTDSPWHTLGRVLQAEEVIWHPGLVPRVHLLEFGQPALLVDGQEVFPKLAKSIELLSFLAYNDRHASRTELLNELFEGRTDEATRSYARQAINKLRNVLPPDSPLVVDAEQIRWQGGGLSTESLELASALRQATELRGRERLDAVLEALKVLEKGEFLPQASSRWADARREELREMVNDARQAAAEAAFECVDYREAEALVRALLDDDPYREAAWRLSMRLAGALGNEDRVISTFRACERALATAGIPPASATRRLLDQLRR